MQNDHNHIFTWEPKTSLIADTNLHVSGWNFAFAFSEGRGNKSHSPEVCEGGTHDAYIFSDTILYAGQTGRTGQGNGDNAFAPSSENTGFWTDWTE